MGIAGARRRPEAIRSPDTDGRSAFVRHWPLVVVLVIGMGYMATVTLLHSSAVSPIDEPVYIDYVTKVYGQFFVRDGELIGEFARQLYACHGVIPFGRMGPECGTDFSNAALFPYEGITTGSNYPPLQFWIVRAVGDALGLIPGVGPLAGWRLVGTLWLGAGLVMSYLIARRLRIADGRFVVVALAFVASPFAYWSFSYVSTDAPIFCYGALVLWLAVRFARREGSGWWLVLAAFIGPLFKPTALVVLGLVLVYLIGRLVLEVRRPGAARGRGLRIRLFQVLAPPVVAFAVGVGVQVAWTRVVRLLALGTASADQGVATPLTPDLFWQQFTNALLGAPQWVVPQIDANNVFLPLHLLAIAGAVGAVMLLPRAAPDRALPAAVLVAYLLASPFLTMSVVVVSGQYFPMPPRYAIGLIPALVIVLAPLLRNRWASRLLAIYTAVLMGYQLVLSAILARWFP